MLDPCKSSLPPAILIVSQKNNSYHDSLESEKLLLIGKKTVGADPVEGFLIQPSAKDPSFVCVRLLGETSRPQLLFGHLILQLLLRFTFQMVDCDVPSSIGTL